MLAVSTCNLVWMQRVINGYSNDPQAQKLLAELAMQSDNAEVYSLVEGLIRFEGRVWMGSNTVAQNNEMQALHSCAIRGHSSN